MKARDRLVVEILALAGLMAALWFGVLAPKREEAASLGDEVAVAEQRRDAANAKAAEAEKARATYAHDYAVVARLGKATPAQADVPSLVYQLETAARRAKVDFRAVTVSENDSAPSDAEGEAATGTPAGITSVPFSFKFEGTFFKLHKLLRSVGDFSRLKGQTVKIKGRLLTLDSVRLSRGRAGFPKVNVEIVAHAYVAPIPDALPGSTGKSTAGAPSPSTTATQVTK
jgi:Tfp pilus assembly protein PilO